MNTPAPLDVKVIYSASKRRRRGWRPSRTGVSIRDSGLVVLGILNLIAAGGLYYGTCWLADPELRLTLIRHLPLPGVDIDAAAEMLTPSQPQSPGSQTPTIVRPAPSATPSTTGQTARAVLLIATVVGWEALAVITACALALLGGALLGQAGTPGLRLAGVILGLVGLVAVGWAAYGLWGQYGRFVPDQLRTDIGGLVLLAALLGLVFGRGIQGLTYLVAITLILSAAGSVLGLYIGAQYDAVKTQELPLPFFVFLVLVFVIHSLWGWILLPLASRIRPY